MFPASFCQAAKKSDFSPAAPETLVPDALLSSTTSSKWDRRDWCALAISIAIGLLLSTLPHLIMWFRIGQPVWIATHDSLDLYLPAGSQTYFGHLMRLTDVIGDQGESVYSTLEFLPGVWIAKMLGLGPLGVDLGWRIWAGLTIPFATWLIVRRYITNPWCALGVVALVIGDGGLIWGQPLYSNPLYTAKLLTGHAGNLLATYPILQSQWRLITPGLSLAYLFLFIYTLGRATQTKDRRWTAAAGAAFGLLFWTYLYFWTTAVVALPIAFLADKMNRWKYFQISCIGGLLGLPAIIAHAQLKKHTATDWLWRSDYFLPIPHFSELEIPKVNFALFAILAIWVLLKRRDLIYLASLALAPLLLLNMQVVTGLQVQNFHWKYASGPVLVLLMYILIAGASAKIRPIRPWLMAAFAVVCVAHTSMAFYLRRAEAIYSAEPVSIMQSYLQYREQRLAPGTPALASGEVIAGDPLFASFATIEEREFPLDGYAIMMSPYITDQEWYRRTAFNAYLSGMDRDAFVAAQQKRISSTGWGTWSRNAGARQQALVDLTSYFDQASDQFDLWLQGFKVRYLALPAAQSPPDYLNHGWTKLQAGPDWQIWRHDS